MCVTVTCQVSHILKKEHLNLSLDGVMKYDSSKMYGVSKPISNTERKSRGYAYIQKDTGFDKLKFEK